MKIDNINFCCKLCGSNKVRIFLKHKGFNIYRCECGMMFREYSDSSAKDKCRYCKDRCIDRIYDEKFLNSRIALEKNRLARIVLYAGQDLRKTRVLEIGSGAGVLASLMVKEALEYSGTEVSALLYSQLEKSFPYLKNKVVNALFPDKNFKNYFDIVVAVDVLEFLPEPVEFLNSLKYYLKDEGVLYLELPNEYFLRMRANIRMVLKLYSCLPVNPGHMNFFTKQTTAAILEKAGFTVKKMSQTSISSDTNRMFLTLKKRLSWFLKVLCIFLKFSRLDLVFQQGNIIVVSKMSGHKIILSNER